MRPAIAALGLLLGARSATAAEPLRMVEVTVAVGGHEDVHVGALDGAVSLDPRVAEVEGGPGRLLIAGLGPGVTTVRGWGPEGAVVVRVTVIPVRPPELLVIPDRDETGFDVVSTTRLFVHADTDESNDALVLVEQVGAALRGARGSATADVWGEWRGGAPTVPQALLTLATTPELGPELSAALGTVPLAWGPFTFAWTRIAGASLTASDGPRWTAEVAAGKRIRDVVLVGGPRALPQPAGDPVVGARVGWRLSEAYAARAEIGVVAPVAEPVRATAAVGATVTLPRFDAAFDAGFDGRAGALATRAHVRVLGTDLFATAGGRGAGFTTPRDPAGAPATLGLTLGASRKFGDPYTLSASSGLDRIGPPGDAILHVRHHLDGTVDIGRTRVRALMQATSREDSDGRWRTLAADLSVDTYRARLTSWLGLDTGAVAGHRQVGGTGDLDGHLVWEAVGVRAALSFGPWATLGGAVERRFTVDTSTERAPPWSGEVHASGQTGELGPLAYGRVDVGWRRWDTLGLGAGSVVSGTDLFASANAETRPWKGMTLTATATLSPRLASGPPLVSAQIALRVAAGHGSRRDPVRQSGPIKGVVFDDVDGDGVRDAGEEGVPDVQVRAADRPASTGPDGTFRIRGVHGADVLVLLVDGEDARRVASTPRVQEARGGAPLAFGLGPRPAVVEVLAFDDIDGDGVLDPGEAPLGGMELRLDIEGVGEPVRLRTRADEPTRVGVAPGHAVAGTWGERSVPTGYDTTFPAVAFTAQPGETVRIEVPLAARRSIRGVVYLDADGDGRKHGLELAVEGVAVRAGERVGLSGVDGDYLIRGLPAGPTAVVVIGEVPPGWTAPAPRGVDVATGPFRAERIDVGLLPAPVADP